MAHASGHAHLHQYGQAAGIAAALAAKHEIQPRNVPVKEIRDILKRNGVNP